MPQIETNEFRAGVKVEVDGEPYTIIGVEFVKPGKGQAFTRTRLKHLKTERVVERTFKSGEKLDLADVEEETMRLLYVQGDDAVFMDDESFEQLTIPLSIVGEAQKWLMEETLYDLVIYKGTVVSVTPPTFMNLKIVESDPGVRGDSSSGRVMKPAVLETGAKVQVPIFIEQGETIKVDTRTAEYVSRV